jgi:PhnO protein
VHKALRGFYFYGMIKIRRAQVKDINAVYAFINDLENIVFDKKRFTQIYKTNLKNKDNIYLVAVDQGPIGYISCHVQLLLHHGGPIAEIQELYVTPSGRSKGIGKILVDALKTEIKKRNIPQVEVTSGLKRTLAHKFYEKENFEWTHKKFIFRLD